MAHDGGIRHDRRTMKNAYLFRSWAARLFILVLGGVSVFGFAPFYLFPLPVLALAGLFRLVRSATPREALLRGWLFGLGWFLAGVSWVYVSMHDVGGLPLPLAGAATFLFAIYLALFPALAMWLGRTAPGSRALRLLGLFPVLWALSEWLRGWFLTGFPWQALGYSQVPYSPLAGYAPILGVYGVSWLAAVTAGALALWRPRPLLLAAAIWLAGLGLMQLAWTQPAGAPVTVSLAQGDIAQTMKFRPEALLHTLRTYARLVLESNSKLVVLPETAFPLFRSDIPADYLDALAEHVRSQGGDLLFGVPVGAAGNRYYNSVESLGVSPPQRYDKSHLVPFGEFVPYGFRWLVDAMHIPLSDFSRGAPDQAPMAVAGQKVALAICYEDVFGGELIHALPEATLMVNVSNDAWFGDSFAPWQHLQITQMRALETGRWWLKDTNTGVTAVIDAKGRVVARMRPFTVGTLDSTAQGMTGATPYARWGNSAFLALAAFVLALVIWFGRRTG